MNENDKIKGFLLRDFYGEFFFRIYDRENKGKFKDYEIHAEDLEVEIPSNYYKLVEPVDENSLGILDYNLKLKN